MKKRTKESRKKLNSLLLLIAFTAILLITSTYAWFSTQKDVVLTNLQGKVNVAEGLEVSLDGDTWGNEIDLGTALKPGGKNIIPSEMLPVSTAGEIGGTDIKMLRGDLTKKTTLSNIKLCNEQQSSSSDPTFPGYYAFDIYLRNTNKAEAGATTLQLNQNSIVKVLSNGKAEAGIQNTVRVGFAKYTNTVDPLADRDIVIADTYGNISDMAIWEPNAKKHVPYIVKNNNIDGATFTDGQEVTTYGLKSSAVSQTIADIYKLDTNSSKQNTLKTNTTDNLVADEGVQNLVSNSDGVTPFTIEPNKISKIRVYVWLEGGDVDCTNYASHGGGIEATIGLIKDATTGK